MYGRGKTVPKQNATSTSKLLLYTEGSGEERTNVEKETLTSESMGKKTTRISNNEPRSR